MTIKRLPPHVMSWVKLDSQPGDVMNSQGDIMTASGRPAKRGELYVTFEQAFDAVSYRWKAISRKGAFVRITR